MICSNSKNPSQATLLLLNFEYVCGYVHRNAGTHGGQKESEPLELVTGGCELPKMSAGN